MIGKASEIKTKRVVDGFEIIEGKRTFFDVDAQINKFLSTLPSKTIVLSIQYQTVMNQDEYDQNALIIYKEGESR